MTTTSAALERCSPDTYISPAPGFAAQHSRRYWSSVPPLRTAPQDCGLGGALKDYPCGGVHAMLTWLNASAVKKALNVPPDAYLFLTDNGVGFNYSLTEKNLMPFYREKEPFWGHFLIWNHSKMVRNFCLSARARGGAGGGLRG